MTRCSEKEVKKIPGIPEKQKIVHTQKQAQDDIRYYENLKFKIEFELITLGYEEVVKRVSSNVSSVEELKILK